MLEVIGYILLFSTLYFLIRYFSVLLGIIRVVRKQKKVRREFYNRQKQYKHSEQSIHPDKTAVEAIHEAEIDLEGGEYIDYEEIKEP